MFTNVSRNTMYSPILYEYKQTFESNVLKPCGIVVRFLYLYRGVFCGTYFKYISEYLLSFVLITTAAGCHRTMLAQLLQTWPTLVILY